MIFRIAIISLLQSLMVACGAADFWEHPRCKVMADIGASTKSRETISRWIAQLLSSPELFRVVEKQNGYLLASQYDLGLDWTSIGIEQSSAVVDFYGDGVDYQRFDKSAVGAVMIGYGLGYRLIFVVDSKFDVKSMIEVESEASYTGLGLRQLDRDLMLVCQHGR